MTTATYVAALGAGFASATTVVDGFGLHHVRGGEGPPVLLLHGFPQDWAEWRHVMPALARDHDVVALDLPGVGGSQAPAPAYDATSLAGQVAGLVEALDLGPVHLVGHDLGGFVGYALTRQRPDLVRTLTVLEAPLPGIEPPDAPPLQVPVWHAEMHLEADLPEALVGGREEVYVRHFLTTGTADGWAPDAQEVAHHAVAYAGPDRLRAMFEPYRALPTTAARFAAWTGRCEVPVLLVGGEQCFGPTMRALAPQLRAGHGCTDVECVVVEGARHYLPDECPDEVAALVRRHTQ